VSDFATAEQQAYIYIQDQIVSGVLPGGSRLRPEEISRALGISRMPVREAIRQLAAESYVTLRPNRGPIVTSRTPEQVVELFEIRSALEGLAMRLAAPQVTPGMIENMKVELARLRQLESDRIAWVDHHDAFHDMLCELSKRPHLCAEIRRLRLSIKPYLRHYVKGHADAEIKDYEHEYILEALESGNPQRAEQVMREHVMANAEAIANCLPVPSYESARQRPKGSHREDLGAASPQPGAKDRRSVSPFRGPAS
jgi:DNA-binding GntR family transcriptional regulator